jgi:hypothetical protein
MSEVLTRIKSGSPVLQGSTTVALPGGYRALNVQTGEPGTSGVCHNIIPTGVNATWLVASGSNDVLDNRFMEETATSLSSPNGNSKVDCSGETELLVSAPVISMSGTIINFGASATDRVNFIGGGCGASDPEIIPQSSFTGIFGSSSNNILGSPRMWLSIQSNGNAYLIPCY